MKLLYFILLLLPMRLFAQNRYDVVIDEIMADPSPRVGLPDNEWIELKNVSGIPIDLQGWTLEDGSAQSGAMPSFVLRPDSFVIVSTAAALPALAVYGTAISITNFPSLSNDGETLVLRSNNGTIIHAVGYSSSWFDNEVKEAGGWSLEMMDTKNPCAGGDNWKSSKNQIGGTPGQKNSIDAFVMDDKSPRLKNSFLIDKSTIVLVFDEPLDSFSGTSATHYIIDGGLSINEAIVLPPLFNEVQLKINSVLSDNIIYTITADVNDCSGNPIGSFNIVKAGLPTDVKSGDLVINEILFNPRPNGYDYVEIYNKSDRIFDASSIYIGNRNSAGAINTTKKLSTIPTYIFPGDYIVVTENAESLQLNYLEKNPDRVFVVASMPSYPDDEGDVVLLNGQGEITDEVKYNSDWHFKLIANSEGVALERVDPNGLSQDPSNWHSAASTAGYGTPTYMNSQWKQLQMTDATVEITPRIFSPDNDGRDDIATIQYKTGAPGYVATIIIYDVAGRPVRILINNRTMSSSGYWNWDGLNDKGAKLPTGNYIIYTEMFNLEGRRKRFKNAIVLARRR